MLLDQDSQFKQDLVCTSLGFWVRQVWGGIGTLKDSILTKHSCPYIGKAARVSFRVVAVSPTNRGQVTWLQVRFMALLSFSECNLPSGVVCVLVKPPRWTWVGGHLRIHLFYWVNAKISSKLSLKNCIFQNNSMAFYLVSSQVLGEAGSDIVQAAIPGSTCNLLHCQSVTWCSHHNTSENSNVSGKGAKKSQSISTRATDTTVW